MTTHTHVTIPAKPPVEVIEAMIEAAIANKNNVEVLYKAIVDYFVNVDLTFAKDADEDQIMKMAVGNGTVRYNSSYFVTLTTFCGPDMRPAVGFITPDTARGLGMDLIGMAKIVEGKS